MRGRGAAGSNGSCCWLPGTRHTHSCTQQQQQLQNVISTGNKQNKGIRTGTSRTMRGTYPLTQGRVTLTHALSSSTAGKNICKEEQADKFREHQHTHTHSCTQQQQLGKTFAKRHCNRNKDKTGTGTSRTMQGTHSLDQKNTELTHSGKRHTHS